MQSLDPLMRTNPIPKDHGLNKLKCTQYVDTFNKVTAFFDNCFLRDS